MKAWLLLVALGLLACAPRTREDREGLRRKPIVPAATSGWARIALDREAQKAFPTVWIGDDQGNSVPFLVERDGLWQPRRLELERLALGTDSQKRPTAEFALKFPEGWQLREREQLHLQLELEGQAPWVCRVAVERWNEGSAPITLERDQPVHVFDLGEAGRRTTLAVPWDSRIYRLALTPVQGGAPRIKGVEVTATTEPSSRAEDDVVIPRIEPASSQEWNLSLEAPDRIVGAEVRLKPSVAPLAPEFTLPLTPSGRPDAGGGERFLRTSGLLWNLPALGTESTRVAIDPITADRLRLRLPEGARLDTVRLLVRREVLLVPMEAGKTCYLHLGGQLKPAPGNLAILPDSSRALFQRQPLALGASEADPQGVPTRIELPDRALPWLPWVTGLAVLLLAVVAWRLLKPSPS